MVVSVKTINLGDIDGYLTLRNNRIDINLKCDSEFSDVLNADITEALRIWQFITITFVPDTD